MHLANGNAEYKTPRHAASSRAVAIVAARWFWLARRISKGTLRSQYPHRMCQIDASQLPHATHPSALLRKNC